MRKTWFLLTFLVASGAITLLFAASTAVWPATKAQSWYAQQPWQVGSNYIPSTAINELEMWQADTFDLATIDRELGWAESLGMNTMRVFLHNLPWQQGSDAYLARMDRFLEVADRHHIRIMFVLLDSVWDPNPKSGKQRVPRPHVHNSGWVQAPGAEILGDRSRWDKEVRPYVVGVIGRFRNDRRVLLWDLMNEPDNDNPAYKATELPNKQEVALQLLKQEWQWARSAHPSQPLTSGVWKGNWAADKDLTEIQRFQLENSDVITFHSYDQPEVTKRRIESLRHYGRPIICTEYMARPLGSTFASILPLLKESKVAAYNWGFVNGKSQTIYPWDSWEKEYSAEPAVWFHDIFRQNGEPYDAKEVQLIKQLTNRGPSVGAH
jgi:hypothetical protein